MIKGRKLPNNAVDNRHNGAKRHVPAKHAPRRLNRDHRGNRSHADVDRSVITGAIGHRLVLDHPIDHARGRASGKHDRLKSADRRERAASLYKAMGNHRL